MERAMSRVISGLTERGIQHSVLLLSEVEGGMQLDASTRIWRTISPPRDPRMALAIHEYFERLRPTVVHVRNWGPWPDTTLARAFTFPAPPLVWSFHGVESLEPLPLGRRATFRAAAALTSRIFAVSASARALLVELVGIAPEKIDVIMNGIDTDLFAPVPLRTVRPRIVVGAVGRLEPIKNHALLIEAVGQLAARGLELEVRFAGRGSLRPALERLAAERGISGRVQFLGHVDDIPAFLRDLDLLAMTSDSEGNPNALLEAMSSGVACVATRVGAIEELFDRGRAGILVPPRDVVALASAVERLALSPELRTRFGVLARERVLSEYSLRRMLDAYEDLYRAPRRASGLGLAWAEVMA